MAKYFVVFFLFIAGVYHIFSDSFESYKSSELEITEEVNWDVLFETDSSPSPRIYAIETFINIGCPVLPRHYQLRKGGEVRRDYMAGVESLTLIWAFEGNPLERFTYKVRKQENTDVVEILDCV